MTTQRPPVHGLATHPRPSPRSLGQLDHDAPAPEMRRFEIAWLRRNGDFEISYLPAPAHPIILAAFSAFTHGSLIQTPNGPVAIEDLLPGDVVETVDHGPQPVIWRGGMTCPAARPDGAKALTRIMADALGLDRPSRDLLAGPGARILERPRSNTPATLTPVASVQDGVSAFAVHPAAAVQLYHLCLPIHGLIRVNGLVMESYHPGVSLRTVLPPRLLQSYLALFPHIDMPGDFGPLSYPRDDQAKEDRLSAV